MEQQTKYPLPNGKFIAYTAGILDKSYINIIKRPRRDCYYWHLVVQVSSKHKAGIYRLYNTWKIGCITTQKIPSGMCYNWVIYGKMAEYLLKKTAPLMKIKQAQAKIAISFRKLVVSREQKLTPTIIKRRFALVKKLKNLNATYGRGKKL
jgi:hypothetical protein